MDVSKYMLAYFSYTYLISSILSTPHRESGYKYHSLLGKQKQFLPLLSNIRYRTFWIFVFLSFANYYSTTN